MLRIKRYHTADRYYEELNGWYLSGYNGINRLVYQLNERIMWGHVAALLPISSLNLNTICKMCNANNVE